MGYLIKYLEENKESRDIIVELLVNKQIEIVNGGYSANDEATSYYEDIIEQMSYGMQFVWNNLNRTLVSSGWNVDSFGSSLVHSYLLE